MIKSEVPIGVMEAIQKRCSVRSYSPLKLDQETIRSLLDAAVRAPTAIHEEPWEFVICQDRMALKRISDRAKPFFLEEVNRAHLDRGGHAHEQFASPEFNIFYDAGTLIIICGKATKPFVVADCWLAAENLMLAACAMGLGSCVIGSAVTGLNTPEVKAELGIPAEISAIVPIIVGEPSGTTAPTSRKGVKILAWK